MFGPIIWRWYSHTIKITLQVLIRNISPECVASCSATATMLLPHFYESFLNKIFNYLFFIVLITLYVEHNAPPHNYLYLSHYFNSCFMILHSFLYIRTQLSFTIDSFAFAPQYTTTTQGLSRWVSRCTTPLRDARWLHLHSVVNCLFSCSPILVTTELIVP